MDSTLLAVLTVLSLVTQRVIELTDVVWESVAGSYQLKAWVQKAYGLNRKVVPAYSPPPPSPNPVPAEPVSQASLVTIRTQAKKLIIIVAISVIGAIFVPQILPKSKALPNFTEMPDFEYAAMMGLLLASGSEGMNAIVKLLGKVGK